MTQDRHGEALKRLAAGTFIPAISLALDGGTGYRPGLAGTRAEGQDAPGYVYNIKKGQGFRVPGTEVEDTYDAW